MRTGSILALAQGALSRLHQQSGGRERSVQCAFRSTRLAASFGGSLPASSLLVPPASAVRIGARAPVTSTFHNLQFSQLIRQGGVLPGHSTPESRGRRRRQRWRRLARP